MICCTVDFVNFELENFGSIAGGTRVETGIRFETWHVYTTRASPNATSGVWGHVNFRKYYSDLFDL